MPRTKRIIEGFTSNQEVRAGIWKSEGKETVYQIACNIYKSEYMARRVYGKDCYRRVRIIAEEIK